MHVTFQMMQQRATQWNYKSINARTEMIYIWFDSWPGYSLS